MTRLGSRLLALALTLGVAGCAQPPTLDEVAATLPPIPPGDGRIFVYRDDNVYQGLAWVRVFFNGNTIGAVGPGQVIMRDVPAGTYDIAPDSQALWPNQNKIVTLTPGEVVYAKVGSFLGLNPDVGVPVQQVTYAIMIIDPAVAQEQIGHFWYMGAASTDRRMAGARAIVAARE